METNFKLDNQVLTIIPDTKIDSTNAEEAEKQINDIIGANTFNDLVIDADRLVYISSVGLRIILRLRKTYPTIKIINVSSEVYDIFDMTGFTEMIDIQKGYRKLSVDGCEVIGHGAKGDVYRWNPDTIVKVYKSMDSIKDIQRETELARKAFVLGVPTAIPYDVVKVGDKFGSVFELLSAASYSKLLRNNPDKIDDYAKVFADVLKIIHGTTVKPTDFPDVKPRINGWIATDVKFLNGEEAMKLQRLVDQVPEQMNLLHLDYHTNNIMDQNGEAIIIDMDTLSHGHPIFELANIYITYVGFGEVYKPMVEDFMGLSYDVCCKFWELFIPKYLDTTDPSRLEEVGNKIKLLSYMRLLSHYGRRNDNSEVGQKTIELAQSKIKELLKIVDTLVY